MSYRLPILVCLLFGVFFIACEQELAQPELQQAENTSLDLQYTTSPIDDAIESRRRRYRFADEVAYGDHPKMKLDIFTLESRKPSPLVVFFHSGGFTGGNKAEAYDYAPFIRKFISKGVAFATVNYRFLDQTNEGVLGSLNDIKRSLQFLRHHAETFNIDPERVAAMGVSAGAGASLWLGTHDDMANPNSSDPIDRQSSRVSAVAALGTQATYDLVRWEEIFAEYGFKLDSPINDLEALHEFYGIDSTEELYAPTMESYRSSVDMLGMFTAGDAPVYVYNNGKANPPRNDGELFHHPYHALAVGTAAEKVGVENVVYAPGMRINDPSGDDPTDFLLRHLKE